MDRVGVTDTRLFLFTNSAPAARSCTQRSRCPARYWIRYLLPQVTRKMNSKRFPLRTPNDLVIGEVGEDCTVDSAASVILLDKNRVQMTVRMVVTVISPPNVAVFIGLTGTYSHRTMERAHSISDGLLKSTVSLTLPCPNCGNHAASRLPGSRLEAVSSGGKITSEFKNSKTLN